MELQQSFFWNVLHQFYQVLDSITPSNAITTAEQEYCERFLELIIDLLVCIFSSFAEYI